MALHRAGHQRVVGLQGSADPTDLRLQALRYLWRNRGPEDRDQAVDFLRLALDAEPLSAALHNDLATTLLLRAGLDDRAADLLEGLSHAQQARQLAPEMIEAQANLAFALESFGLQREAAPIWQALLEQPTARSLARSFLAQPARWRRTTDTSLETEKLRRLGQEALGRWAMLQKAGVTEAARHELAVAAGIAECLTVFGDNILEQTIDLIESSRSTSPKHYELLLSGHSRFAQVQQSGNDTLGASELEQATEYFSLADSPFHAWSTIELAILAYYSRDLAKAEALLATVAERWGSPSRPFLNGRVHWLRGLTAMRRGYFSTAEDHYQQAVAIYRSLGEDSTVLYLHLLESTKDELMGNTAMAWKKRLPAILQRFSITDPVRTHTVVEETTYAVGLQASPSVMKFFLNEQVRAAKDTLSATKRPEGVLDLYAFALLDRAAVRAQLGDRSGATRDLEEASQLRLRLPEFHENRERLRLDLAVHRALYLGGDLVAFEEALRFYGDAGSGDHHILVDLYAMRARRNQELGNTAAARRDLEEALRKIEAQRWEVLDAQQRARYLKRIRDLTDSLIQLELESGHLHAALLAMERAENRILLDSMQQIPEPTFSLSLDAVGEAVPEGTAVLRFGSLPDQLLVWTLKDGHIEFESRPIPRIRLRQLVEGFREAIYNKTSLASIRDRGEYLAELLLPSTFDRLPVGTPLVFVPHSELLAIPFAALVHQERYLIENHPVITTPSLAFLVTAAEEGDSLLDTEGASALIVADPTIESGRYSTLPSLRFARRGVEKLEDLYRGRAEILTGTEATYDRVLRALPIVRVFSYAGHAVPSPPIGEPGLVLASEWGTEGAEILTARSLSGAPLRQLELVVLAACSSGPVNYPESNEITGLAMAFLAQGAHQVISTLWDVDDQAAEDLSFHVQRHRHRHRQNGQADLALQAAQLSLLRGHSPRFHHPIYWASFQLHMGKLPPSPSKPLETKPSSLHPPNLGKEISP